MQNSILRQSHHAFIWLMIHAALKPLKLKLVVLYAKISDQWLPSAMASDFYLTI